MATVQTPNQQSLFSTLRQIAAYGALVMGFLTSTLAGIKLPVAVSSVMAAFGAGLLWIEHYVADPSTGTPPTTTTTTTNPPGTTITKVG
jgi:hypothetical protein